MAAPTSYSLSYDFTSFQASNPTDPLPADKIEIEFNDLETTTGEIITNLGLIQRSDGALANDSVGVDQLKTEVTIGVNAAVQWVTLTDYVVNDMVYENNSVYRCLIAHNSGTFSTDLSAGKWELFIDTGQFVDAAEAAQTAAELAETNAGTAQTAAELAETNAGTAQTAAELAETNAEAAQTAAEAAAALLPINNFIATSAPTTGDDSDDGYSVGSRWVDVTADESYICVDASVGAAAWLNSTLTVDELGSAALLTASTDGTLAGNSDTDIPTEQAVKTYVDAAQGKFESQLLHVRDEKSAGSDGGTFTSGAWRTRVLNTTKTNEITGASLGSNQITLPAGTYYIDASAPAYQTVAHQLQIYDTTGTATLVTGQNSRMGASGGNMTHAFVSGRFTLGGTSDIELQHRCSTTSATNGLGIGSENTWGTCVFAEVKIWKVA